MFKGIRMFKSLELEIKKKRTTKNCSGGHYKELNEKKHVFDMIDPSKILIWIKDSESCSGFKFFTCS